MEGSGFGTTLVTILLYFEGQNRGGSRVALFELS